MQRCTDTHTHTGFHTIARTHKMTHTFSENPKKVLARKTSRFPEDPKSPRKKKRPRTFGLGHENVPQVRSHNTQIIQRACSRMRSWAHAHAAGAMLTSKDLPETYRNVHSEDAEDVRIATFSEDRKKVIWSRARKCPPKWGLTNTHTHTHIKTQIETHLESQHMEFKCCPNPSILQIPSLIFIKFRSPDLHSFFLLNCIEGADSTHCRDSWCCQTIKIPTNHHLYDKTGVNQ